VEVEEVEQDMEGFLSIPPRERERGEEGRGGERRGKEVFPQGLGLGFSQGGF
jgi:hypothetical protein